MSAPHPWTVPVLRALVDYVPPRCAFLVLRAVCRDWHGAVEAGLHRDAAMCLRVYAACVPGAAASLSAALHAVPRLRCSTFTRALLVRGRIAHLVVVDLTNAPVAWLRDVDPQATVGAVVRFAMRHSAAATVSALQEAPCRICGSAVLHRERLSDLELPTRRARGPPALCTLQLCAVAPGLGPCRAPLVMA